MFWSYYLIYFPILFFLHISFLPKTLFEPNTPRVSVRESMFISFLVAIRTWWLIGRSHVNGTNIFFLNQKQFKVCVLGCLILTNWVHIRIYCRWIYGSIEYTKGIEWILFNYTDWKRCNIKSFDLSYLAKIKVNVFRNKKAFSWHYIVNPCNNSYMYIWLVDALSVIFSTLLDSKIIQYQAIKMKTKIPSYEFIYYMWNIKEGCIINTA